MMIKRAAVFSLMFALGMTGCDLLEPVVDASVDATLTMVAFSGDVKATVEAARPEAATATPPSDEGEVQEVPLTDTPLAETPTPTPTLTEEPQEPIARVNQNTNCRAGNGTVFKILYIALIGEELKVTATTTLSDYVVVEIPDKPGQTCWLWTRYVELQGDQSQLPVRTPPPTPTPTVDFNVSFDYVDSCVGWDPSFKVVNTGNVTFNSYYVKATDTVTTTSQDHTSDDFDKTSGCPIAQAIPQLDPGDTGWVYAYSFPYNPAGNAMTASVKLCTGAGLTGTCVTKNVNFTP
jgi:hypothetical protein